MHQLHTTQGVFLSKNASSCLFYIIPANAITSIASYEPSSSSPIKLSCEPLSREPSCNGRAVIVFLHLLGRDAGQLNSWAVLFSYSLSRMAVSRSTGDVFLTDQDTVYLLPGDLSEITGNVSHTVGQTPKKMMLSKQEDKLIVCWASSMFIVDGSTVNGAPCVVYNSTDLLQTLQMVPGDSCSCVDVCHFAGFREGKVKFV